MNELLLNNKSFVINTSDLPLIIHGQDGYGASQFSLQIMARFYQQGAQILCITGFSAARDSFNELVGTTSNTIVVQNTNDLAKAHTKQVIMVPAEHHALFVRLLHELPDIQQRIIYFKNFNTFASELIYEVSKHKNLVLQGDLSQVQNLTAYKNPNWATKIYFTAPPTLFDDPIPQLTKYTGYLRSAATIGAIRVAM